MAGSTVPGVVTAGILIGATEWLRAGEVDLELLGGDPTHFQTNIFQVNKGEKGPLYGVFGKTSGYASGGTVGQTHAYTIDWSPSSVRLSCVFCGFQRLTPLVRASCRGLSTARPFGPSRRSRRSRTGTPTTPAV